jgi:hypothetical protein
VTDVDVGLARSAQLVARARRQQAVQRLQKATLRLRGVLAARWTLVLAVVATAAAGFGATPLFFACTVLCGFSLVLNVRTVAPQHRVAVAERELELAQAHTAWEAAMQRMLDTEARHEETP